MGKTKEITLADKLNTLAETLMTGVPADIKGKTDSFLGEVAKAVASEVAEAEKKVVSAEKKVEAIEKRTSSGKTVEDEKFFLGEVGNVEGTFVTLHRDSTPNKPLYCMYSKKSPEPTFCGAHCVGFKILTDGNVEICSGSIREIVRKK